MVGVGRLPGMSVGRLPELPLDHGTVSSCSRAPLCDPQAMRPCTHRLYSDDSCLLCSLRHIQSAVQRSRVRARLAGRATGEELGPISVKARCRNYKSAIYLGFRAVPHEISRGWRACMGYLPKHDRRGSAQGFARAVGA